MCTSMTHGISDSTQALLAFGLPGGSEWIILLLLGLLIFGRRLPEVGRSIGKSIVEFKKGIKGIEEEIDTASSTSSTPPRLSDQPAHESSTKATVNPYASTTDGDGR